ncbi:MAG: TraR/DksA C4-type zinc finger protein [Bacteroidota bacterium]|nr:TraR/DksA C4-type zinc finger protein [Bacteroidota bacterium]
MAKSKKSSTISENTIKLLKEKAKKRKIEKAKPKPKPRKLIRVKPVRHEITTPDAKISQSKKNKYSAEELAYFKKIILEKKKEIIEELDALRNSMMDTTTGTYVSENSTYSTHMEQGTDSMEREKTFLFADREGKFLNYLEDALIRIEKGDYGRCFTCGKLIEKERLEAVPHASQCLQCKVKTHK